MSIDPVCGMSVDSNTTLRCAHAGEMYMFCCATCRGKFASRPHRYANRRLQATVLNESAAQLGGASPSGRA